jgi:NitT/TauT family transport system substrate-binding protein
MTRFSAKPLLALFLAAAILAFACSRPGGEDQGIHQVTVKLPWVKNPEFAFVDLGVEKGFFRSRGIDLAVENSRGSHQVVAAFDTKSINFGFLSGDSLVIARQKGVPVQALFVLFPSSPAVIVSLKDSNIRKPKDLLGKSVGIITSSTTFPQFRAMLKNAWKPEPPPEPGEDYYEIEAVSGGLAQLQAGQIDALTHYENFAPIQLEVAGYEIAPLIYMRDYEIDIYSTVFATTDEFIRTKPELVQNIVNAMLDSLELAVKDPEAALAALNEQNEDVSAMGEPEYLEKALAVALGLANSRASEGIALGFMDKHGWYRTERTLQKTGQAGDISEDYYFDDRFFSEYHRKNGS